MDEFSLKISNYKCFGEDPQGFDYISPINIIIGRNNSGKSALLDLIHFACQPYDLTPNRHKNNNPEAVYKIKLKEPELRKVFDDSSSGGDIQGNHWELGKQLIGHDIIIGLDSNGTKKLHDLDASKEVFKIVRKRIESLTKDFELPPSGKRFIRLRAERDIIPERVGGSLSITDKGVGATTLISSFVNKASLSSELVEDVMLYHLNNIVYPDLSFSRILVQENATQEWEVYLVEQEKGRIALSQSGSGLKTILLVLVAVLLIPEQTHQKLDAFIFGFEELENNLHPAIQRKLLSYIHQLAITDNSCFFITTHSNVVIDMFSNDPTAQV